MKKTIVSFLLVLLSAVAVTAGGGAVIAFETKSHDFGTIKEADGPVSCEFEFQNAGDEPLVIFDVTASCGCTRPEYPKDPIAPGKKAKMKVTYNPAGRPGEFERKVKIRSNTSKRIILKITGVVIPEQDED